MDRILVFSISRSIGLDWSKILGSVNSNLLIINSTCRFKVSYNSFRRLERWRPSISAKNASLVFQGEFGSLLRFESDVVDSKILQSEVSAGGFVQDVFENNQGGRLTPALCRCASKAGKVSSKGAR